jgi:hypothetical protein
MLGIAFVVVVALGLAYVARRSHQPRGIGAFRSRSSGLPIVFDVGGNSDDDDAGDATGDADAGDADSSSSGGDSVGDGGGGDGGGGGSD